MFIYNTWEKREKIKIEITEVELLFFATTHGVFVYRHRNIIIQISAAAVLLADADLARAENKIHRHASLGT